jgi:hypothetical protein
MHGKIDPAPEQRVFELLGEKALAAGRSEWPVLNAIPGRADGHQFAGDSVGRQGLAHKARLRERKL